MSVNYQRELATAVAAVRRAAGLCRTVQQELGSGVIQKQDSSPVTVADYGSQAIVCKALTEAFPDDPIIAEEDTGYLDDPTHAAVLGQVVEQVRQVIAGADAASIRRWIGHGATSDYQPRFWTLDPIDGTKGFVRGDQYVVALALIVGGELAVSAMAAPNLPGTDGTRGLIFSAVAGQGAYVQPLWNTAEPVRIHVSPTSDPRKGRFCESFEAAHSSHSASGQAAGKLGMTLPPVRMDSQAKYGVVAAGQADLYMRFRARSDYMENIWDHASGALLVIEAGGQVTDITGKELDFTCGRKLANNVGLLVTNGLLHDAVLAAARS